MNRNMKLLGMAVTLVACVSFAGIRADAVPEATISRCDTPPVIDGRLDDACWKGAAPLTDFFIYPGDAKKATQATIVRACFDANWLYLGVLCNHSDPKNIAPKATEHDGAVHNDEALEIFIDPGTEGAFYAHLMLNAANIQAEQSVTGGGARNRSWNPIWRSATTIHSTGWNAEIAIPLYVLAAHGDLAQTRINIVRNAGREQSTWSPLTGGYHNPGAFGPLKGMTGLKPEIPYLAFGNVKAGSYYQSQGKACYDVTMNIGADPAQSRAVKVVVTDKPVTGKDTAIAREISLAPGNPQTLTVTVPVEDQVRRDVHVAMADTATGKELQSETLGDVVSLLLSVYLDRSYYTTEDEALAVCSVRLEPSLLQGSTIIATDDNGNVLGRSSEVSEATQIALKVGALAPAMYPLRIELRGKDGTVLAVQQAELIKRAPKPGCDVKVDHVNRVLLRDGKPFFPFGILLGMYLPDEIRDERHFQNAAQMGFNTVVTWGTMAPEDGKLFMDMATKYNLNVVAYLGGFFGAAEMKGTEEFLSPAAQAELKKMMQQKNRGYATMLRTMLWSIPSPELVKLSPADKNRVYDVYYRENLPRIISTLDLLKDYPNLIGYKLFDEPAQYVAGRKLYRQVHETDGHHPTFLIHSSFIPPGEEWVDWTDVLGTDPYWVPGNRRGAGDIRGTVNYVSKITALTDMRAAERRQVTFIVPLAEFWMATSKRPLLRQEQFCQTYLAIIHGAKAICYFRHPLELRETLKIFADLSRQMEQLGPIAVAPEIPQKIEYESGTFNPLKNTPEDYPDVQVALMRNPAGGYVLVAANTRNYPVEVTYKIPLLEKTRKVGRLFAKDEHKVRDGTFSDKLEPMGTRAYTFDSTQPVNQPVAIKVAMKADRGHEIVEQGDPVGGRVGKKNIMVNPSFEEATFPGRPDYYICSTPGLGTEYFIGDPNARFSLDPTNPVHGKFAVKMVSKSHGGTWVMAELWPKEGTPTDYVFSVYMKADRDGMEAGWFGFNKLNPVVKLTREWKRYIIKGTVPFVSSDNPLWGVRTDDVGTMWVDAIQLEKGSEPTEFEP